MRKILLLILVVCATIILTPGNTYSIDISGCSVLDVDGGVYYLTQDIINATTSACINITANNVILDCQGHVIDGDDTAQYGIYIDRDSVTVTNITIRNCTVSDWSSANIHLHNADGNVLEYINSTSSTDEGIELYSSSSNNISNIIVNSNGGYGIYLYYSNNNALYSIEADSNEYDGVSLWFSDYNNITDITATSNSMGIYLYSSDHNVIYDVYVDSNTYDGIYLDSDSDYNTIKYSKISNNQRYGIHIYDAGQYGANEIYNNLINNSVNVYFEGTIYTNNWNTDKQVGDRIYKFGNMIGGNFWAYPNGTGYSETCTDADGDGFCDDPYTIATGNVDNLPLSKINPIGDCYTIPAEANGEEFYVVQDIINSQSSICIDINANNVLLDCKGHTIDGVDSAADFSTGINVNRDTDQTTNITIKNCTLSDWYRGIIMVGSNKNTIENVSVISSRYGIHIASDYNVVKNVTLISDTVGVYVYGDNNDLQNIVISDSKQYGIQLSGGNYNTLSNMKINNSNYGIYLETGPSTLSNITILNCTYGIYGYYAYGNTISDSMFSTNNYGIYLDTSYDNTIKNNIIEMNDYGLYLKNAGSTPNKIYNNLLNNSVNLYFEGTIYSNYFNTTRTSGTNIIGQNELGGNYWAYPNGTGYSEMCTNADHDSFCDDPYTLATGNVDYLPLRYYNYDPVIHYVNLSIYDFSTTNNFTVSANVTDKDSITDRDQMCFLGSCVNASITDEIITLDINDVFNTTNGDFVIVNDTYGGVTQYQLYYGLTNNDIGEVENNLNYLSEQRVYKSDTICNFGSRIIYYYIKYSDLGGTIISQYNTTGSIFPMECKYVSATWTGDWIYESISQEQQDPNYPAIANETMHTYIVLTTNNTITDFSNVSISMCRSDWTQNVTYISIPKGVSNHVIGCSKDNVVTFTQSQHVLNTGIHGVVVDEYIDGYYNVTIKNNDDSITYSTVFVETTVPYPYTNTSPYIFIVDINPLQTITKRVNITGKPVVELSHNLTLNSIPSYRKYIYTAQIEVYDDAVSNYQVTYLINKSILTQFDSRDPSMDKYTVDGKSYGVVATENDTHVILTVTTDFTSSSLHEGTHTITYTYYVYDPRLVGGGGGGGGRTMPIPLLEVKPEELNIDIIRPNVCNETTIKIVWTGSPQQATIRVSEDIRDIVVSPKNNEKIWLNRQTVLPVKICIPEEMRQETLVTLKGWSGYIEISSQGTYGLVSKRVVVNVNYKAWVKIPKPKKIDVEKLKYKPVVFIILGVLLLLICFKYDRILAFFR